MATGAWITRGRFLLGAPLEEPRNGFGELQSMVLRLRKILWEFDSGMGTVSEKMYRDRSGGYEEHLVPDIPVLRAILQ